MPELDTVDFNGVEILAAAGPIHGKGSPPEGDSYSADDLRRMASDFAELTPELRAPAKIGHGGDQPAVGWLDRLRVSGDATKLLADIRGVPKRLAGLINAGAYRTRSVELSSLTSQRTGKKYGLVPTGMAWLGGKMPAVRTLDDVVALYEGEAEVELERVYEVTVEADPDGLRDAVAQLGVTYASEDADENPPASDTRSEMDKLTITGEAATKLVQKLGLGEDADAAKIEEALDARENELVETKRKLEEAEAKLPKEGERAYSSDEIAELAKKAEAGERAEKKLYESERRDVIEGAVKAAKIAPAERDKFEKLYEADEETTKSLLESLTPRSELRGREFGGEGEANTDEQSSLLEANRERIALERGVPKEQVL